MMFISGRKASQKLVAILDVQLLDKILLSFDILAGPCRSPSPFIWISPDLVLPSFSRFRLFLGEHSEGRLDSGDSLCPVTGQNSIRE